MQSKNYQFVDCECLGVTGNIVTIPAGIWPVIENKNATVLVGVRQLDLDLNGFQLLKLDGRARLV